MARPRILAAAAVFGLMLGGCAGGNVGQSGASLPILGPETVQTVGDAAALAVHRPTGSQIAALAIAATNAIGSRVKETANDAEAQGSNERGRTPSANGSCRGGIEFFAPDRKGDPDSTETIDFYDAGCAKVARDAVRIFTSTGAGSENVSRIVSFYTRTNQTTAFAVRSELQQIANATFGKNGFPLVADGFQRAVASQLSVRSAKQIVSNSELVMLPSQTNVSNYCQDSAGYNATGIPSLDETFGWQGGSTGTPTRTAIARNVVTWSSTQSGSTIQGPIGSLSIAQGSLNTACPIVTPAYTLSGGTVDGTYTVPITVTYRRGELWSLTIANASFSSGATLNVKTRRNAHGGSIHGVVSSGGKTIATFQLNTFGNGTLTITSTGAQYYVIDWNVVR